MTDGILNLNKPRGPTSHDIVAHVRALTNIRRVGHAGTLDPLATGVLLVCIGRATRVAEYLMAGQKVYRARARLGITTDTYDAEGQVVAEAPVEATRAQVEAALAQFRGKIAQVPPMYSAIKHKGTPLHRLARQGVEAEQLSLKPRQVEISRLELVAWEPPECTLEMTCSPGTYVRALAHDLGQALGCGAHVTALARLSSGDFSLEDAITLDELAQAAAEDRWTALLHPIDTALAHFPALHLDADAARRLCSGQTISTPPLPPPGGGGQGGQPDQSGSEGVRTSSPPPGGGGQGGQPDQSGSEGIRTSSPPPGGGGQGGQPDQSGSEGVRTSSPPPGGGGQGGGELARAYGPDETFLALVAYDPATGLWRPRKVFHSPGGFS